ncbi:MAG: antibiotic ABC transporter ATP-binding protein [Flavobacteriales bacterium]|nr:MAG: antibiotic ABC transporter ATP-binding protein [Flavobacteriales bacterium]
MILANFIFNLLYVVFQLVSLMMIMPVLRFLFLRDTITTPSLATKKYGFGQWFNVQYHEFIEWFGSLANGEPFKALAYLAVSLVIVTVVKNTFRYLAMNVMVLIRNRSMQEIRLNIYERCLALPISYFTNERKGDLLSRMSNDVKEIEFALMVSLEALYFQPLNILLFMFALLALSAKLTLYIVLFLPITALIIGIIGRSLRRKSTRNQQLLGKVMTSYDETLGGIRIIKAFNAVPFFSKKYKEQDDAYTRNNIGVQRRYDLSSPLSETIGIGVSALLLWLGGSMVFRKEMAPEFFLTYFAIFSQLIPPFKAFSNALYAAQKGMASLERIQELVTAPISVADPINPVKPQFNKDLSFKDVGFSYINGNEVIKGFELCIEKGKTIALVGPSGAGKTTITDLIARFYDVTQGSITLDGIDIRKFTQDDLRSLIGIVNQESILFNESVRNNIALGKVDMPLDQIIDAAKAANAHDFIMEMEYGYDTEIGERGGKLSGGQKQRLAIARALLKDPEILILDEATSSLDSKSEKAVQSALDVLMKSRTSIVIAHRLSTVIHADLIVVMDKGKAIEIGNHKQLLKQKGMYYNLIQLQQLIADV